MRDLLTAGAVSCVWYDGHDPEGRSVLALLDDRVLRLFDPLAIDEPIVELPVAQLEVTVRAGEEGGALFVRGTDQCVEVASLGLIERIGRLTAPPAKPPSILPWLAAALALAVGVHLGLPAVSQRAAAWLPTIAVQRLKVQTLDPLEPNTLEADDARLFQSIVTKLGETQPVDFVLVGKMPANAFALPGRTLVLTEALVCEARSSAELFGVVAHELGHLHYRHSEASWLRSHLFRLISPAPAALTQLAMSRDEEEAADRFALRALDRAGVSKQGLAEFFRRHRRDSYANAPTVFSTHPSDADRVAAIPLDGVPLTTGLSVYDLAALQTRHCKRARVTAPPLPQTPPPSATTRMAASDGRFFWPHDEPVDALVGTWLVFCDADGGGAKLQGMRTTVNDEGVLVFAWPSCNYRGAFFDVPGLPPLGVGKQKRVVAATFHDEADGIGAEVVHFGKRVYRITASADDNGVTTMTLDDGRVRQAIYVDATRSNFTNVVWAGDLDGDQRLDLIVADLNVSVVYLSSAAGDGELVKAVVAAPQPLEKSERE